MDCRQKILEILRSRAVLISGTKESAYRSADRLLGSIVPRIVIEREEHLATVVRCDVHLNEIDECILFMESLVKVGKIVSDAD